MIVIGKTKTTFVYFCRQFYIKKNTKSNILYRIFTVKTYKLGPSNGPMECRQKTFLRPNKYDSNEIAN